MTTPWVDVEAAKAASPTAKRSLCGFAQANSGQRADLGGFYQGQETQSPQGKPEGFLSSLLMEVANAISWVWLMICPGEDAHALEILNRGKHICERAAGAMHVQGELCAAGAATICQVESQFAMFRVETGTAVPRMRTVGSGLGA